MAGPPSQRGVPRRWRHLPRRTARLRLTLLYSGMFLVLGTAALAATYAFTTQTATLQVARTAVSSASSAAPAPGPPKHPGSRFVFPVASQQLHVDDGRLLTVSWFVLVVTALASAILGWFVSGRVLRPVRQMTETARTLSAGNLGGRLALTGPDDEFKRLADTFDELLGRLQSAFEAQRRFVANASHELRTPLTVERTLLQVALADPNATAATLRAICEELLASGRDQELLLEALLTLATSERGLERSEPVDLAALTRRALDGARGEIERRGLALTSELAAAPASGDAALLERLAANLIDNATRYNRPDGSIEVRTGSGDAGAWLTVDNTGPLIGAGEVDRLFEPFQRLGRARIEAPEGHHGLGLSIVRAIVAAHGGTVEAVPRPDGGLTVTVTLSGSPPHGPRHRPPPPA